jgi:demethylspheroidene O-methyltransferase
MSDVEATHSNMQNAVSGNWWEKAQDQFARWTMTPGAYAWALSNPITRWVVRRRTQQVFDLMAGFVHSQVVLACVRLSVFSLVQRAPITLDELAIKTQVPQAALQRLVNSAVALRLLSRRSDGCLGLGPLGAPIATHPGIQAMVEHNNLLYRDMMEPIEFLRDSGRGHMAQYWPYAQTGDAHDGRAQLSYAERYSQLMASSQNFVVEELLRSYDFKRHQCVLDVGGGKGQFVANLAARERALKFLMFDLPSVLPVAQQHHTSLGLAHRVSYSPGSFFDDPLPLGADLVTLIRVAHDHPDAAVKTIFRKIFDALPVGGTFVLAEPMAQSNPSEGGADAYFHFYLMAMGEGRFRTPGELTEMLIEAGFSQIQQLNNAMPIHARILVARKSKCLPVDIPNTVTIS